MNLWLKETRNKITLEEWWLTLKQKLVGHYRYYGMSGNSDGINAYYHKTMQLTFKWINRRSQKKSMTWGFFNKYLSWNPVLTPKIYHRITIA